MKTFVLLSSAALAVAPAATAGYTFTQSAAQAPTYASQLNFDAPGTPTGFVNKNAWQPGYGVSIYCGDNPNGAFVDNFNGVYPWLPNNNAVSGPWGVYVDFDQPVTNLSFQAWSDAGPPTFFGGGLIVWILDANDNIIDGDVFNPAWGGVGNTWFNISATGASTFSRVLIAGNSFALSETIVDNLSWNTVPGPGAAALLALGMAGSRRRRA
jgi:hypothetical protein